LAGVRVEAAGFLGDFVTCVQERGLARDFGVDCPLHEAERVDVLQLAARAELLGATWAQ
jgi:hypothetical protein